MKILAFSDLHLDYPADPSDGSLDLFARTSAWLVAQIETHEPGLVVNLGDTNHRDGGMSTGTIKLTFDFFDPIFKVCGERGIKLVNLVGNHDQHTRDGGLHVVEMLKWSSSSLVVDRPHVLTVGDKNALLMPYMRDQELFAAEFQRLTTTWKPNIAFIHMDVVGAKMNSGVKATSGFNSKLIGDLAVWGGHYHLPQAVGGIQMVGSPQYTQFRDTDSLDVPRRGAVVLASTKTAAWEAIRLINPHTNVFVKIQAETGEGMQAEFSRWAAAVDDEYVLSGAALTGRANVWFVGPKVELAKLEAVRDWSTGFGIVRFTPNDRTVAEETELTLDLNPERAVKQFFESAQCTCGQPHQLAIGLEAIKRAADYDIAGGGKRHIRFKSMELADFMQFQAASVNFETPGLFLIEGINQDDVSVDSNESGKSSIVEALLWCLFDRTSRGIGKDEVIRWGAKKAQVSVSIEADGNAFTFVRGRAKGKQILHVLNGEGKDITPHDQNAATTLVQSIIGTSFEQFLLLVVMAQGFETKFSSLSDTDRKATLEAFLGLEVYDAARKLIVGTIADNDSEAAKLDAVTVRATSAQSTAAYQRRLAVIEREKVENEQQNDRAALELQITEYEAAIPTWREAVRNREAYSRECFQTCRNLSDEIQSRRRKHANLLQDWTEGEKWHGKLTSELVAIENGTSICTTCQQPMAATLAARMAAEVKQTLSACLAGLEHSTGEASAHSEAITVLEAQYTLAEEQERAAAIELKSVRHQSDGVEFALVGLRREHEKTANTVDRFDTLIANSDAVLVAAANEITAADALRVEHATQRHELKFWQDAFEPTGIRSQLLRTVVNYLNEYLYDLSQAVTSGTFVVQLSSTKELKSKETRNKLDVVITPSGESYKAGSGGKRRKIDLMLNLAVGKLARQTSGFSTNLFVGDEVLDNLDFTASQFAIRLFERMAEEGSTVLLISHNQLVKSMIPNAWTVVRRNGISELQGAA